MTKKYDVVVAGGGPSGLAAAASAAVAGAYVLLCEQNTEIGSPTRTTGGSFIRELEKLDIPAHLYHPIERCRFLSPTRSACFDYQVPVACVIDVRGVYQLLAERAVQSGAEIRLGATVERPIVDSGRVLGVHVKSKIEGEYDVFSKVVIDAAGHRSSLLRQAGIHPGFQRFGVGAEYDLYAPHFDQREVVLIVGTQVAPSGYAWAAPWGRGRVRVGVGIIHRDSTEHPNAYLDRLIQNAASFGMNLRGAQPVEYHFGLIPSDGLLQRFVGDGIMGVGDAAGQSSTLLGEGIRWSIKAGHMAGSIAADSAAAGDTSRAALARFEQRWMNGHGANLRIGQIVNRRIAHYDDAKWDRRTELLNLLTPEQFAAALQTNFTPGWVFRLLRKHPSLMAEGFKDIVSQLRAGPPVRS